MFKNRKEFLDVLAEMRALVGQQSNAIHSTPEELQYRADRMAELFEQIDGATYLDGWGQ